ncbi:hypothetical protein DEO72_LG5g1982 [Vigna unguiculata]|uniref:Uncharacterized protein n=1 Tax=Vigna unguiculata TaxID=3917 RepID=A0A4D6LYR6_VIGUN|nr:hypothetical protein DEO72_LG5g1982 [Vigna unguiculata]
MLAVVGLASSLGATMVGHDMVRRWGNHGGSGVSATMAPVQAQLRWFRMVGGVEYGGSRARMERCWYWCCRRCWTVPTSPNGATMEVSAAGRVEKKEARRRCGEGDAVAGSWWHGRCRFEPLAVRRWRCFPRMVRRGLCLASCSGSRTWTGGDGRRRLWSVVAAEWVGAEERKGKLGLGFWLWEGKRVMRCHVLIGDLS